MKEILTLCIAGVCALGVLCGAIVRCSEIKKNAITACIEKTGEPLECQATFRGQE